jgi:hypothetical protein
MPSSDSEPNIHLLLQFFSSEIIFVSDTHRSPTQGLDWPLSLAIQPDTAPSWTCEHTAKMGKRRWPSCKSAMAHEMLLVAVALALATPGAKVGHTYCSRRGLVRFVPMPSAADAALSCCHAS